MQKQFQNKEKASYQIGTGKPRKQLPVMWAAMLGQAWAQNESSTSDIEG